MGRIRTIKPEFWEDEKIGTLSPNGRLLFIATWNLADDEGLLRWSPAYIKASVFMYDALNEKGVAQLMEELVASELIFAYRSGPTKQPLALIVNFRKHQRINRPQPGKLQPPYLQALETRLMYAGRDGWICALCGLPVERVLDKTFQGNNAALMFSMDHITPVSKGGTDYPSNIRLTHQSCNMSRGARGDEQFRPPLASVALSQSLTNSVNSSMPESLPEGKGKEQGARNGGDELPPDLGSDAQEENEIPDDLPALALGRFMLGRLSIPHSMALSVHFADAVGLLARDERVPRGQAAKLLLDRARDHPPENGKWRFWLDDGQWKAGADKDQYQRFLEAKG